MGNKGPVRWSEMKREDLGLKVIDDRNPIIRKVCHGDPARSFWFRGRPLPLCSRCTFLYPSAVVLIPLSFPFFLFHEVPSYIMLVVFLILNGPLVIDGYSQYVGWRSSNNLLRAVTGALSGAGIGLGIAYFAVSLFF